MEGKKPIEQASESKPATEAQIGLIKALYEETQYKHQYTSDMLVYLTREEANKHINFLKEHKVRDQQLRSQNQRATNFDKIGFGLAYKLAYDRVSKVMRSELLVDDWFNALMYKEYQRFKGAQKYAREQVEEGGQQ